MKTLESHAALQLTVEPGTNVWVWSSSGTITGPGGVIPPDSPPLPPAAQPNEPVAGIQVVVLDQTTLKPILSKLFYADAPDDPSKTEVMYDAAATAASGIAAAGYFAAVAIFGVSAAAFPSTAMLTLLNSWGMTLEEWTSDVKVFQSADYRWVAYAGVGKQHLAEGEASEDYQFAWTEWRNPTAVADASLDVS